MDPERWQRVQELLAAALEIPEAERGEFLARECGGAELEAEVASLLEASDEADEYFGDLADRAGLASEGSDELADDDPGGLSGRRVGAYELTRFLGRGGMGTVYLAERADGQFAHPHSHEARGGKGQEFGHGFLITVAVDPVPVPGLQRHTHQWP